MDIENIESVNECISLSLLSDLDALELSIEQNDFDASCYNRDACQQSSG